MLLSYHINLVVKGLTAYHNGDTEIILHVLRPFSTILTSNPHNTTCSSI